MARQRLCPNRTSYLFRLHRRQQRFIRHRELCHLASVAGIGRQFHPDPVQRIPESRSHGVQQQQFRRLLRPPSRNAGFREPGDVPRAQSNRGAEWFAAADSQYAGYAVLVQTTPCLSRARPPFPRRRGRNRQRSEGDPQSRSLAAVVRRRKIGPWP